MNIKNPLYKNQGMHVLATIFTVYKGNIKVLLIRRDNKPYKDMWSLVGGAVYNNETLDEAMLREIREKTNITDINIYKASIFDDIDRSPIFRMFCVSYIGIIDSKKISIEKLTEKTKDADWFSIDAVPHLAYDGNLVLTENVKELQKKIINSDILRNFYSKDFTMPELLKTYEIILNKKLDRRNFRKKLLNLVEEVNKEERFIGNKPAKLYRFKRNIKNKNVL